MKLSINSSVVKFESIEELAPLLEVMDAQSPLEAWISIDEGPMLALLRQGPHAFMVHFLGEGDSGATTRGSDAGQQLVPFTLANGQGDTHPLAWCVPLEECLKAFAYFCVNAGARYPYLPWFDG